MKTDRTGDPGRLSDHLFLEVQAHLDAGELTVRSKTGAGSDVGRQRSTFSYADLHRRPTCCAGGDAGLILGAPAGDR